MIRPSIKSVLLDEILHDVKDEILKAMEKHEPMPTIHHGKAVIQEELDELWDEIKEQHPSTKLLREEALQVAAMGVRFIFDLCIPQSAKEEIEE